MRLIYLTLLHPLRVTCSDVYKACMDEEGIERRGLGPLLDMLERLGGWPVLSTPDKPWNEDTFDWMQTVYRQVKPLLNDVLVLISNIFNFKHIRIIFFEKVYGTLLLTEPNRTAAPDTIIIFGKSENSAAIEGFAKSLIIYFAHFSILYNSHFFPSQ
jgi:hypothetical protein